MEVARKANGKRLPKDMVDTIRAQFWESIDRRLDDLDAALRKRGL